MKLIWKLIAVFIVMGNHAGISKASPSIIGDTSSVECQATLNAAEQAYYATNPNLFWPIFTPVDPPSQIVFSRNALDISGGNGIQIDDGIFERLEIAGALRQTLFWQRNTQNNRRLVLLEQAFNWRGDHYHLFNLAKDMSQSTFIESLEQGEIYRSSVLMATWVPPVIAMDPISKTIWAIDHGSAHLILGNWRVLDTNSAETTDHCQIAFLADQEKHGLDDLPSAIRRFAELADEALGSEVSFGTLRPFARIRGNVAQGWATITERPWALTNNVYNTRAQVDDGLKVWAAGRPVRAALLNELNALEKVAIQDLAVYYEARYGLSKDDAVRFSVYAIDYMFRRHFVFSITGRSTEAVTETPWPEGLR